jgi:hypothetical protein
MNLEIPRTRCVRAIWVGRESNRLCVFVIVGDEGGGQLVGGQGCVRGDAGEQRTIDSWN